MGGLKKAKARSALCFSFLNAFLSSSHYYNESLDLYKFCLIYVV